MEACGEHILNPPFQLVRPQTTHGPRHCPKPIWALHRIGLSVPTTFSFLLSYPNKKSKSRHHLSVPPRRRLGGTQGNGNIYVTGPAGQTAVSTPNIDRSNQNQRYFEEDLQEEDLEYGFNALMNNDCLFFVATCGFLTLLARYLSHRVFRSQG